MSGVCSHIFSPKKGLKYFTPKPKCVHAHEVVGSFFLFFLWRKKGNGQLRDVNGEQTVLHYSSKSWKVTIH